MSETQDTGQNDSPNSGSGRSTRNNPLVDLLLLALRPKSVSPESATAVWIRRHPILALVGLAYGLTWIGMIPLIRDPNLSNQPGRINPSIIILAFFGVLGCLWAALIVASAVGGSAGRYALLRGYFRWYVNNLSKYWFLGGS